MWMNGVRGCVSDERQRQSYPSPPPVSLSSHKVCVPPHHQYSTSHTPPKALKPQVDLETAVSIAREVWGLTSPPSTSDEKPRALDSYDDNNFYIVRLFRGLLLLGG